MRLLSDVATLEKAVYLELRIMSENRVLCAAD